MTRARAPGLDVTALLTSRRLAVGLICTTAALLVVATLVPQGGPASPDVVEWTAARPGVARVTAALGLHSLFSSPAFLLLVALLALATGVCAWERTKTSVRIARGLGAEAVLARLAEPSAMRVALDPPADGEAVLADIALRLRGQRMAVTEREGVLSARAGTAGLIGSPLFHSSLALLLVTVAIGALVRSEGPMPLPSGEAREVVPANYQVFEGGRLYRPRGGLALQADDLRLNHMVDGIDVAPTPLVTLLDGRRVLASTRVYPNNPLRWRSIMVHMVDFGLAPKLVLQAADGTRLGSVHGFSDFDAHTESGTTPSGFELTTREGSARYSASVEVVADKVREPGTGRLGVERRMPAAPAVLISVAGASGSVVATRTRLGVGEALRLPDGSRIRLEDVVYFARVSVVDDPSVYVVYALLGLSLVGSSLALTLPYRVVWVTVSTSGESRELVAVVRHQRGAPGFRDAVERMLSDSAGRAVTDVKET